MSTNMPSVTRAREPDMIRGSGYRVVLGWLSIGICIIVFVVAHVLLFLRGRFQPLKTWNPVLLSAVLWHVPLRWVILEFREIGGILPDLSCQSILILQVACFNMIRIPALLIFFRLSLISLLEHRKVEFANRYLNAAGVAGARATVPHLSLPMPAGGDGADKQIVVAPDPASASPPAPIRASFVETVGLGVSSTTGAGAGTGGAGNDALSFTAVVDRSSRSMLAFAAVFWALIGLALGIFLAIDRSWSDHTPGGPDNGTGVGAGCGFYNSGSILLATNIPVAGLLSQYLFRIMDTHRHVVMEGFGIRNGLRVIQVAMMVCTGTYFILILCNPSDSIGDEYFDPSYIMYIPLWAVQYYIVIRPALQTYRFARSAKPLHDSTTHSRTGGTTTRTGGGSGGTSGRATGFGGVAADANTPKLRPRPPPITIAMTPGGGGTGSGANTDRPHTPNGGGGGTPLTDRPLTPTGTGSTGGGRLSTPGGTIIPAAADKYMVGLVRILLDPIAYPKLVQYAQSEFNAESILFWSAVESYRTSPTYDGANRIFATFFADSAPLPLNVSFQTTQRARADRNSFLRSEVDYRQPASAAAVIAMFDSAQREVFGMIRSDIFPRFRASKVGESCSSFWLNAIAPAPGSTGMTPPGTPPAGAVAIEVKATESPKLAAVATVTATHVTAPGTLNESPLQVTTTVAAGSIVPPPQPQPPVPAPVNGSPNPSGKGSPRDRLTERKLGAAVRTGGGAGAAPGSGSTPKHLAVLRRMTALTPTHQHQLASSPGGGAGAGADGSPRRFAAPSLSPLNTTTAIGVRRGSGTGAAAGAGTSARGHLKSNRIQPAPQPATASPAAPAPVTAPVVTPAATPSPLATAATAITVTSSSANTPTTNS